MAVVKDYTNIDLKATDQYVTVNGRLADAAAQGLQSINCRVKGAQREQRIWPLLLSHIDTDAIQIKLIGIIIDLKNNSD